MEDLQEAILYKYTDSNHIISEHQMDTCMCVVDMLGMVYTNRFTGGNVHFKS